MPQMKGETQEQYMDRLRAVRGLPPMRQDPTIMDRTRAAVCLLNSQGGGGEASKLNAFLAIFHPEIQPGTMQYIQLMLGARAKDR